MNVTDGASTNHRKDFYWSLLWVALWWVTVAILFAILDSFRLIDRLEIAPISWWRSILEGILLAPVIENAIMVGFIALLKPWAKDWLILLAVCLLTALAHMSHGLRAIPAAGLFVLVARYYLTAERREGGAPFILSTCLHAIFNTPAVLLSAWSSIMASESNL